MSYRSAGVDDTHTIPSVSIDRRCRSDRVTTTTVWQMASEFTPD